MTTLFYIDRSTGTFADELTAAGFIRLLEWFYLQQGIRLPQIVQTDEGYRYVIECRPALDLERVAAETGSFYPAPIIKTTTNKKAAENQAAMPDLPLSAFISYDDEKQKLEQYIEAYKRLDRTAKRAEIMGEAHEALQALPAAPHSDWDIFRMINPAALIGYNTLMLQWHDVVVAGQAGAVAALLCAMFQRSPNDVEAARAAWRHIAAANNWKTIDVTASQFYNPSQGKGVNRPKPDRASLDNLRRFWPLEWLKAIGFYEVGLTRNLQGVNDRKTYVPVFGRMSPRFARNIHNEFRHRMRFGETAVRSDILAVIRYVQTFLSRGEDSQGESEEERWQRELLGDEYTPADFVHGFQAAFYKDLGNAVTTMNLSFLKLPGWVIIRQDEDVAIYQDLLREHEQIISQFTEDRSVELDLLTRYRDFLVADNLEPFLDFTTAYSSWLMSEGEKPGFPPRQFTAENLRRLFMSAEPNLSVIVESEGFKNIAGAIRQSTVIPQNDKANGRPHYEVRYGLGRDLVRQSQYRDRFIADLSDFLFKYSAENSQAKETHPELRPRTNVHVDDIRELLELMDRFDPDLIAKLLVAYGYAYAGPRQSQQSSNE